MIIIIIIIIMIDKIYYDCKFFLKLYIKNFNINFKAYHNFPLQFYVQPMLKKFYNVSIDILIFLNAYYKFYSKSISFSI